VLRKLQSFVFIQKNIVVKVLFLSFFLLLFKLNAMSQTLCVDGMAGEYPCEHIDLLAFIPKSEIGGAANTNDIWGWVSPVTGKEFALVGCSNGTAFVDISNPIDPLYLGLLPTHTDNNLWRDLETYQNYCFIASEAPDHGLRHCHTLTINTETGFLYAMGTNTYDGGLHIVNIQDPLNPTLAGGFSNDGYTHDGFVWSYDGPDLNFVGKEVFFACNEDELTIVDVTDKLDCIAIGSYDYEGQALVGYIHQGWVTKDKRHFLIDDELDEIEIGNQQLPYSTRTHMFDITSLENVGYMGFYENGNSAIDHNLYVQDQFVYQSNYRNGIRVLDAVHIADSLLTEIAYFDLFPTNDFAQFSGTWSNYPYLPSGVNIATSMYEGFFILRPRFLYFTNNNLEACAADQLVIELNVRADLAFPLTVEIQGLPNAVVVADTIFTPGTYEILLTELSGLPSGNYFPDILLNTSFGENYVVPFSMSFTGGAPSAPVLTSVPDNALVSNTEPNLSFEWQMQDGDLQYEFQLATDAFFNALIDEEITSQPNHVTTFLLPDGTYYWRVRVVNGCGTGPWSIPNEFTVAFVGVNEIQNPTWRVFPNPTDERLTLISEMALSQIEILNITGEIVRSISIGNGDKSATIDCSQLASGCYLIRSNNHVLRFSVL
jgi:hypothetical protein